MRDTAITPATSPCSSPSPCAPSRAISLRNWWRRCRPRPTWKRPKSPGPASSTCSSSSLSSNGRSTTSCTPAPATAALALGRGKRVQVEFVSANPTGPLHVGHGRGAAYGASLANLLAAAGFDVAREYYVNDAGRQMDILALSTWLRYLELCGVAAAVPAQRLSGRLRPRNGAQRSMACTKTSFRRDVRRCGCPAMRSPVRRMRKRSSMR